MREVQLVDAKMISPSVRLITVDPGPDFSFCPGQWVSFRIPNDPDDALARAYSIASSPRVDGRFEIAVTRVDAGLGSNYLHQAPVGAVLRMTDAQGLFTLESCDNPLLMVATGTGVSPFRSMITAALDQGRVLPPTILLFGTRTTDDLIFREEFEAIARHLPSFRYVPTLSRAEADWQGRGGYVQAHVPELIASLGSGANAYVCGLNRMIKEVRSVLKTACGFARDRIHTERYD